MTPRLKIREITIIKPKHWYTSCLYAKHPKYRSWKEKKKNRRKVKNIETHLSQGSQEKILSSWMFVDFCQYFRQELLKISNCNASEWDGSSRFDVFVNGLKAAQYDPLQTWVPAQVNSAANFANGVDSQEYHLNIWKSIHVLTKILSCDQVISKSKTGAACQHNHSIKQVPKTE